MGVDGGFSESPPNASPETVTSNNRGRFRKTKNIILKRPLGILFIFLLTTASAQTKLTFKINIDSLAKIGIDTFFVYKNYCVGCKKGITTDRNATKAEMREKWCEVSDPFFIFYKSRGKTYVKKTNECYSFKPIQLDTSRAFSFFSKYFDELLNERVLTNSYVSEKGDTLKIYQQHGIVTEMYLSKGQTKELVTEGFDFSEKSMADKINVNFNTTRKQNIFV